MLEKYEGQSFDIVYSKLKNNIPKQFCEDIKLLIFYNANAKFKWYGGKFVVYNNKIYNVSNMKDCCLMCNTLIFEDIDLNYIKSTFLSLDKTYIYVMCKNCVRAHIHKDPNIIDEKVTELDYKKYKMLL